MIQKASESIAQLANALVAANADLTDVQKKGSASIPTKSGGTYSYAYATLPDILQSVRPVLAKHGLAVLQNATIGHDGNLYVSTMLIHHSGEYLALEPLPMPLGHTAQETGSAITYGRRYHLLAALGLAADDDDDGSTAAPRNAPQRSTTITSNAGGTVTVQQLGAPASEKQLYAIKKLSKDLGKLPPANLDQLTKGQASDLIGQLDAEKANAQADQEEPF